MTPAFEGYLRQTVEICMGIDKEKAKELTGIIKGLKLKCRLKLRKIKVSSAQKDELQAVIAHLKGLNFLYRLVLYYRFFGKRNGLAFI
jgi:uncharacterized protein YajQ (UPF0234 family)